MKNKQNKCHVCDAIFTKDDDIVVCPECGAAYHRECYNKEGKCIVDHNKVYENEETENTENTENTVNEEQKNNSTYNGEDVNKFTCNRCGNRNAYGSLFCNKCGNPLNGSENQNNYSAGAYAYYRPNYTQQQVSYDSKEEIAPGVTVEEYSAVVGANVPYYYRVAMRIKQGLSAGFNFCAFLFSALWFFFRKQYKLGCIFAIIMAVMIFANAYVVTVYSEPVMIKLLENIGINYATETYTSADLLKAFEFIDILTPFERAMIMVPSLIQTVQFAVMAVVGIIANKSYYKYCVNTARKIKTIPKDNYDHSLALKKYSGVNPLLTIGVIILYFAFNFIVNAIAYQFV